MKLVVNEISKNPYVYNIIQWLLNSKKGRQQMYDAITGRINLKDDHHQTVLDVGCGTGEYSMFFKDGYCGIDNDATYLNYARKKYGDKFFEMSATALSFPDEKFDYVFCVNLLHHLTDEEVHTTLEEMKRVCKKGGEVYIMDAVYKKMNLIGNLLLFLDPGGNGRTFEKFRADLGEHGFSVLAPKLDYCFPHCRVLFYCKK